MRRRLAKSGRNTVSLVQAVSEALDCTYGEANYLVDLIGHVMMKALRRQERIRIAGIGTFKTFIKHGWVQHTVALAKGGKGYVPAVYDLPDLLRVNFHPHRHIKDALKKEPHDTQEPRPSEENS